MRLLARLLVTCLFAAPLPLLAQPRTPGDLLALLGKFPPLAFSAEPKEEIGILTNLSNAVFKPKGDGPFPAVVLVHTCGGIKDSHIRTHADDLLAKGFVVLVQDSFNPRGRPDCGPANQNAPSSLLGARDAYDALRHLSQYPFVDKARIYEVGYSWGGFVAALLASDRIAAGLSATGRFRATIANYSPCKVGVRNIVQPDTDRPLLMLLGERDDETPPATCFPMLEDMKAAGKPVQWHVFPGTTHGWDKTGQGRLGYVHDRATTHEATRRMLEFIAQNP